MGKRKREKLQKCYDRKVHKVMKEWEARTLRSGSENGPVVKDHKQAVAIAMSEAGEKCGRKIAYMKEKEEKKKKKKKD